MWYIFYGVEVISMCVLGVIIEIVVEVSVYCKEFGGRWLFRSVFLNIGLYFYVSGLNLFGFVFEYKYSEWYLWGWVVIVVWRLCWEFVLIWYNID